jgi:hypothetical protein
MKHLKTFNINESNSPEQIGVYLVVDFDKEYSSVTYFNKFEDAVSYFREEFLPESQDEWDEIGSDRSDQSINYRFIGILRLKPGGNIGWPNFNDWGTIDNNEGCEIILDLREMVKYSWIEGLNEKPEIFADFIKSIKGSLDLGFFD